MCTSVFNIYILRLSQFSSLKLYAQMPVSHEVNAMYLHVLCNSDKMFHCFKYFLFKDNPEPTKCLGIFGLSLYTQERDLREIFGRFGPVEDVQVVYDRQVYRHFICSLLS